MIKNMDLMKLWFVINKEDEILEATPEQVERLENARFTDHRFVQIGSENINVEHIERWKVISEE